MQLARGARIVLSGGVSQYTPDQIRGPSNYLSLIGARASMIGFLTPDYAERYPQARAELARWLREGRLISPKTSSRAVFLPSRTRCPSCSPAKTSASCWLPCREGGSPMILDLSSPEGVRSEITRSCGPRLPVVNRDLASVNMQDLAGDERR